MTKIKEDELQLLQSKSLVLGHEHFKRMSKITQIIPMNMPISAIGAVHSPIKKPFQELISTFENRLKTIPVSKIDKMESKESFLTRHLKSRQNSEIHTTLKDNRDDINNIMASNVSTENNRKKHSCQVSEISVKLGEMLRLDKNDILIAEISSLCHDLGHPPFGHSGQRAMAKKLQSIGVNEHIADDNIQSLNRAKEIGVDERILEALIYHDGKPIKDIENKYNEINLPKHFHKFLVDKDKAPPLAAQLSAISDDIANDSQDILDIYKTNGANSNGKTLEELKESSSLFAKIHDKVLHDNNNLDERSFVKKIVSSIQDEYLSDISEEYKIRKKQPVSGGILIAFSDSMNKQHEELRGSIRELFSDDVFKRSNNIVSSSINRVFDALYKQNPNFLEAVNSLANPQINKSAIALTKNINSLKGSEDCKKESVASEIVKFIYTNLDDRSCYDLSNNIKSLNRIEGHFNKSAARILN